VYLLEIYLFARNVLLLVSSFEKKKKEKIINFNLKTSCRHFKDQLFLLFKEIIDAYFKNHAKPVHTFCGQNKALVIA
jgi:uncharacterized protein (DUF2132 family)